jgi:hypothetical protein
MKAIARELVLERFGGLPPADRATVASGPLAADVYTMSGTRGQFEYAWYLSDGGRVIASYEGDVREVDRTKFRLRRVAE